MAKHTDVFDRDKFEETLISLGHAESWVSTVTSNYKLVMPLVLQAVGAEGIAKIMVTEQGKYGRNTREDWWKTISETIVSWADYVLEQEQTQIQAKKETSDKAPE